MASINRTPLGFFLRATLTKKLFWNPFLDIYFLIFNKAMNERIFVNIREPIIIDTISIRPRARTLSPALRPAHHRTLWLAHLLALLNWVEAHSTRASSQLTVRVFALLQRLSELFFDSLEKLWAWKKNHLTLILLFQCFDSTVSIFSCLSRCFQLIDWADFVRLVLLS